MPKTSRGRRAAPRGRPTEVLLERATKAELIQMVKDAREHYAKNAARWRQVVEDKEQELRQLEVYKKEAVTFEERLDESSRRLEVLLTMSSELVSFIAGD